MPTVVDSLILELSIDPAKLSQNAREALDALRKLEDAMKQSGNRQEAESKKLNEIFTGLKREALGLVGLFLGGRGIKEFVGYVTSLDATTGRMAKTFNMTTQEVSAWQGAMEQAGGSAQSVMGTLQGITGDMNTFMITGQGTIASVLRPLGISMFDNNQKLKSAGELMLDLSSAMEGMDPARASAFLSKIPGMSQDSINLILLGRKALEDYLKTARETGGTTKESAEASAEYQKNMANLERSTTSLGRSMVNVFVPAINAVTGSLSRLFAGWNADPKGADVKIAAATNKQFMDKTFGDPRSLVRWWAKKTQFVTGLSDERIEKMLLDDYGPEGDLGAKDAAAVAAAKGEAAKEKTQGGSAAEREAYIRKAAAARGINPDDAMRVARSEGFKNYIGDKNTSFGDFQLHYGGIQGGALSAPGLGDAFTRKTGKDARDPGTWKDQADFALDYAAKNGWGSWYGARNAGMSKFQGINVGAAAAASAAGPGGAPSGGGNVTIEKIEVVTQATDAAGIARDIKPAIQRAGFAAQANGGQN